jgi:hypothetical protein
VSATVVFAAVFAAYLAGHQVTDFWIQTPHQTAAMAEASS